MTATHFVFVRAMNTGTRRLTNDQQLAPFHAAGFADAQAYQAAGNFAVEVPGPINLSALSDDVSSVYGFEAPLFVRTLAELRVVVEQRPFAPDQLAVTDGKVQVSLLASAVTHEQVAEVAALVPADDRVRFSDQEFFWLPRAGISESSLPVSAIERIVGPMTLRTHGTLERMLKKFG